MEMQKFLQPDQSRIRIQFDAGEKRVTAKATIGLGVIEHIYSRMMESRNQRVQNTVIFVDDGSGSNLRIRFEPPDSGKSDDP